MKAQYDDDSIDKWWRNMMNDRLTSEQYNDENRLISESHNMMTIDWQVKVQYDHVRLKSESTIWWR